jgi:hypothetical protein
MKKILAFSILALAVLAAHGQTAAFNGYCTQGGVSAQTSGLPSTNKLQGIIPQCDVEVFLTGTTTLATIYLDSSSTPLTNPFTADTLGKWLFYAATGQGYDVVMSGGFPPLVYPNPVTLTDLIVGGGGCDCDFSGGHNTNTFIIDDVTDQSGDITVDGIQLNETGTSGIELSTTTGGISLDSGGGISISDNSSNDIDIDESLPGANIGISADNLYFASATPAQAELNSSQICTMATGCTFPESIQLLAQVTPPTPPVNTVQISAPASVTAYNVNMPGTQGAGALTNDGSGNLSWVPGGSGSPSINVDGVTISSPNLDSTAPVADSGYTLGTWKKSGSNISVEVPNATVTSTQSVVTSSRVFGTIYQNTSSKLMIITVATQDSEIGHTATAYSDTNSSPSTIVAENYSGYDAGHTNAASMTFCVLPGNYYKVTLTNGTIVVWTEWTIG